MFTTSFKLYFGMALGALVAAVTFGYTTGGSHVGPPSLGWKGGVGNHVGYIILMGVAAASAFLGLLFVAYRDADPKAQAQLLGTDHVPAQRPAQPTYWPLLAMVGVGTAVLGLVLSTAIFVVGLGILAIVTFEWAMSAWADRATGDPVANRELRDRIMQPIELPVVATLAIVAVPLGVSRVFLASSKLGAVWIASIVAAVVLGLGVLAAMRPRLSKNVLAGIVLVGALGFITAGVVATAVGEREFHHAGDEAGHDEGGDHSGEGK
jgi:MFS family permease